MNYPVALIRTEEGYSVSCPGLPGCWSQGATEEEALANIQDAIREYLAVAKELAGRQNGWFSDREARQAHRHDRRQADRDYPKA